MFSLRCSRVLTVCHCAPDACSGTSVLAIMVHLFSHAWPWFLAGMNLSNVLNDLDSRYAGACKQICGMDIALTVLKVNSGEFHGPDIC
jgi:hypothetical protein